MKTLTATILTISTLLIAQGAHAYEGFPITVSASVKTDTQCAEFPANVTVWNLMIKAAEARCGGAEGSALFEDSNVAIQYSFNCENVYHGGYYWYTKATKQATTRFVCRN